MIKGKDSITILRREYTGETDDYGNSLPVDVEIPVKNVLIAYGPTADMVTTIAEGINRAATLYLPSTLIIKNDDKFRLEDGSEWNQNGAAINWNAPVGFRVKPRQIVEITRVSG